MNERGPRSTGSGSKMKTPLPEAEEEEVGERRALNVVGKGKP